VTDTNQNIDVYRGDSGIIHVDLANEDGSAFDATAPTLKITWLVARTSHALETQALIAKTLGGGITALPSGGIDIALSADDTDLNPALYYHQLRIVNGAEVTMAMVGIMRVRQSLRKTGPVPTTDIMLTASVPGH
jgi:hypothetical protein